MREKRQRELGAWCWRALSDYENARRDLRTTRQGSEWEKGDFKLAGWNECSEHLSSKKLADLSRSSKSEMQSILTRSGLARLLSCKAVTLHFFNILATHLNFDTDPKSVPVRATLFSWDMNWFSVIAC